MRGNGSAAILGLPLGTALSIDDVNLQWRTEPAAWDFDDETANEALARVGAVASMLEVGWEQHLGPPGKLNGI
jgi:hypothetical protein